MDKKKRGLPLYDKIIIGVSLVALIVLIVQLVVLDKLPMKYLIPVVLVFILITIGLNFVLQSRNMNKVNKILSRVIIVLLSVFMVVGNLYLYETNSFLAALTNREEEISISVYVRKDDPAVTLDDVKEKPFVTVNPKEQVMQEAVADFNLQTGKLLYASDATSLEALARSLLIGETDVIFMNDSMVDVITDVEDLATFREDTKILYTFKKIVKVDRSNVDVTKDTFTVLLSGIDTYGDISASARSDVNILMTINPKTRVILMTSIPRDFAITLPCGEINQPDKLTHAGMYGASCSAQAVETIIDTQVDFTVRVNFSSLISIVDAIDGVEVTPQSSFDIDGFYFVGGVPTHMSGEEALAFSRDRYHQAGGDRGRGANQLLVVKALISKILSPAIITNYLDVLNAVEGVVETTLTQKDISKLVKMQLGDGGSWDVISSSVNGLDSFGYTYSAGDVYVMEPIPETVELVNQAIRMVKEGISASEIEQLFPQ